MNSQLQLGNEHRCYFCACVLVACIAITGFAVYEMALAYVDPRGHDINAFERQVSVWSSGASAAFQSLHVDLVVNGSRVQLRRSSSKGRPHGRDRPGSDSLPPYDDLHYVNVGLPLAMHSWLDDLMVPMSFNLSSDAGSSVLELGSVAVAPRKPVYGNKKMCFYQKRGTYVSQEQQCYVFEHLTEICVKVRQDSRGQWRLDSSGGGYGCRHGNQSEWSPLTFVHVWGKQAHGDPFTRAQPDIVDFSSVRVEVRSASDPLLLARNLTNDSLQLPPSRTSLVTMAILLLVVAVCLLIPAISFCMQCCGTWGETRTPDLTPTRSTPKSPSQKNDRIELDTIPSGRLARNRHSLTEPQVMGGRQEEFDHSPRSL